MHCLYKGKTCNLSNEKLQVNWSLYWRTSQNINYSYVVYESPRRHSSMQHFPKLFRQEIILLIIFYKWASWNKLSDTPCYKKIKRIFIIKQILYLSFWEGLVNDSFDHLLCFFYFFLFLFSVERKLHCSVYWDVLLSRKGDKLKLHLLTNCPRLICYLTLSRSQVEEALLRKNRAQIF